MVTQWKISDQESSSDHSIIEYIIGQDDTSRENNITQNEVRYLTKKENHPIFRNNLTQLAKEMLCRLHNAETTEDLDTMLSTKIAEVPDIENSIEEFHGIIKKACDKAYKTQSTPKKNKHTNLYHGGQMNWQLCERELTLSDVDTREQKTTRNSGKGVKTNT